MSKCREAFEAHCKTQVIELDSQFAIDLYFDWQAAWNARGERCIKICQNIAVSESASKPGVISAFDCAVSIEQEQCE